MNFKDMDPRYVLYGALSVLDNTIAALQSEEFSDLTMKQHFLLVSIRMFEESPTLGEISELIGCSYQNVKRMAQQLQTKGYLEIRKDVDDRRKLRLCPTAKLKQFESDSQQISQQFMDKMYRDISLSDLHVTLSVIQKMTDNIRKSSVV